MSHSSVHLCSGISKRAFNPSRTAPYRTARSGPVFQCTLRSQGFAPLFRNNTQPFRPSARREHLSTFTTSVALHTLNANGTLPYTAFEIYEIITDIASYPDFIPYITSSRILELSQPDAYYKRLWPRLATLRIGYGDTINEEFTSRLLCVPPLPESGSTSIGIVEATSGTSIQGQTQIPSERIAHYATPSSSFPYSSPSHATGALSEESPLEFLRTCWTLRPVPHRAAPQKHTAPQEAKLEPTPKQGQSTEIMLSIEYKFRNRVYDMLGSAVAPRMAESMLRTFERRVESLLGAR